VIWRRRVERFISYVKSLAGGMKMKKVAGVLAVLLVIGLVIVPESKPDPGLPRIVNIGTHKPGAFFNVVATAVGTVVGKHSPMQTKVNPMGGPGAWMPMMVTKEIDLGVCNIWDAWKGYLGEEAYEKLSKGKGFPVRLVLTGICNDISITAAGDKGIKTLKDLRGKRLATGYTKVPSCKYQAFAALANVGLTIDDVKVVPVPAPAAGVRAVVEGRADAAGTATTGMPLVAELAAKKGAIMLSYDPSPEAAARAYKHWPCGWLNLIKGGIYPGADVDTWLMRYEIYVLCRAGLSDEAVYEIIKVMWDHNDELPALHPKFKEWTPETYASRKLYCPYHAGSIKFLKEKGIWTSELEKRQRELLEQKK
jgi:TRAP transporter TAXI family solute receptor